MSEETEAVDYVKVIQKFGVIGFVGLLVLVYGHFADSQKLLLMGSGSLILLFAIVGTWRNTR